LLATSLLSGLHLAASWYASKACTTEHAVQCLKHAIVLLFEKVSARISQPWSMCLTDLNNLDTPQQRKLEKGYPDMRTWSNFCMDSRMHAFRKYPFSQSFRHSIHCSASASAFWTLFSFKRAALRLLQIGTYQISYIHAMAVCCYHSRSQSGRCDCFKMAQVTSLGSQI